MTATVDDANRDFWNELCGTQLARTLGIEDDSAQSLRRFDDWYFDFYPYLAEEIPFAALAGKRVLEVGLGYGSVSGRLLEAGAELSALDIASGPVNMVRHRAALLSRECRATQGSILDAPFEDGEFDAVVGIGSYHHTGDTQRALDETWRVLRPGGRAYIMVYNAYSYRRWLKDFALTWRYFAAERRADGASLSGHEQARRQYDMNSQGVAAPHTDFFSVRAMRRMTGQWRALSVRRRNIGTEGPLRHVSRNLAMALLGSTLGLDLYCRLTK